MIDSGRSLFTGDADRVVPTEFARGPWDPKSCHGGPIAALLVRAVERVEDGSGPWQLARITVELLRPVPVLAPLTITVVVERPGRMVSLVTVSLSTAQGVEVAKARALRIRRADVALPPTVVPEGPFGAPGVGELGRPEWADAGTAFHRDSVELRFAKGGSNTPGPVSLWARVVVPLFLDEEPSGAQRVMYAADFMNGVSSELDSESMLFINPDLTVHLVRLPVGEWIGLEARSHYGAEGAGVAEGALYDAAGRLGQAVQSLLVATR